MIVLHAAAVGQIFTCLLLPIITKLHHMDISSWNIYFEIFLHAPGKTSRWQSIWLYNTILLNTFNPCKMITIASLIIILVMSKCDLCFRLKYRTSCYHVIQVLYVGHMMKPEQIYFGKTLVRFGWMLRKFACVSLN